MGGGVEPGKGEVGEAWVEEVLRRTSTMWPVLMRPPLAMEWMSVSSRSIMRVFLGAVGE